jgi:eukaryotic-like serine/threonine-protein kinase
MTSLTQDTQLGGRYRLISRIAIGGMGEVWRAEDELLGRHVAVKVLKSEFTTDPTFLERFRTEARMTASLSHAGIASVYDYGEVNVNAPNAPPSKTAYLVMELVEGEPLSAILARDGRLPTARTLDVVEQAATALEAAHRAGMVHRDVKPGNLLVGQDGIVKITDFGIARVADTVPLTQSGMVVGTAQYFSPEQAEGRSVNAASDVYSLGVVAYECLAGRLPFVADSPVTVAIMQIRDVPPPLPPDVPPAVHQLVARAMAKDARQRFATGGQLAMAVRAVRNGQQLGPVPMGPGGGAPPGGQPMPGGQAMPVVPAPAGPGGSGPMPGSPSSVAAQVAAGLAPGGSGPMPGGVQPGLGGQVSGHGPQGGVPPQGGPMPSGPMGPAQMHPQGPHGGPPGTGQVAPGGPMPMQSGPMQAGHGQSGPMQSQAGQPGSMQAPPGQSGPMQASPPQSGPMQAPPGQSGPMQASPPQSGPMQAPPGQSGPMQASPPQSGPMQAPPGQSGPMQAALPQSGPMQGQPGQAGAMQSQAPQSGPMPSQGGLMQSQPMQAPPGHGGAVQGPMQSGPQAGPMTGPPMQLGGGVPTGHQTGAVPGPQGLPRKSYANAAGRGRTVLVVLLCVLGIALLTIGAILLIRQQNQDRQSPPPPGQTGAPAPSGGGKPADPDPGAHIPSSGPAPGPAGLRHGTTHPYAGTLHLAGGHSPDGDQTLGAARVFGEAPAHQNDDKLRTQ